TKILSTEYDIIYVNECTELTLDDWELLSNRVGRPTLDPNKPKGLLLGDCNPDAPTHWVKVKEKDGTLTLWQSVHEDNPAMWDRKRKVWTQSGQDYLARLERNTGVRYQRMRL